MSRFVGIVRNIGVVRMFAAAVIVVVVVAVDVIVGVAVVIVIVFGGIRRVDNFEAYDLHVAVTVFSVLDCIFLWYRIMFSVL